MVRLDTITSKMVYFQNGWILPLSKQAVKRDFGHKGRERVTEVTVYELQSRLVDPPISVTCAAGFGSSSRRPLANGDG
jgi:hypothetical protein